MLYLTNRAISVALEVVWEEVPAWLVGFEPPESTGCVCAEILPPVSKGAEGTNENRDPMWRE
jgi:hypothetical protein